MQDCEMETDDGVDLEFNLRIIGAEKSGKINVKFDFDPPVGKDGENPWEESGAGKLAAIVMKKIQEALKGA